MKKLEDMNPRDYGMNPREEIVAAAIKAYLLSMPEVERLKVLSEITEPKEIAINLHNMGKDNDFIAAAVNVSIDLVKQWLTPASA